MVSCSGVDYTIDFSKMELPDTSKAVNVNVDSLIKRDNELSKLQKSSGVHCKTDKKKYRTGEVVILTVENKTEKETIYFYPAVKESTRYLLVEYQDFKKALVSKSPAITGDIMYSASNYFGLYIEGVNDEVSSRYNYNGFNEPLEPGEKMVFKVHPPEKKAYYRLVLSQNSHSEDGIGLWGINKFLMSNSFEITAD